MIATGNPLAVTAGKVVLERGGSAVDAAIAADIVMGVVEPMATSIGGDLLAMIIEPSGKPISYNGTGRCAQEFSIDILSRFSNLQIPERSVHAITTPGVVMGWWDLHQQYGKIDWAELFSFGIEFATQGFAVSKISAREWRLFDKVLHADQTSAKTFRAGNTPAEGEIFTNLDLAGVFKNIQKFGPKGFYEDYPAQACVEAIKRHDGVLGMHDFLSHVGNFCTPLEGKYKDITVIECPPNTHGLAVLEALELLNSVECKLDDPSFILKSIQAMEMGMQKAKKVVADPAGNTVCTVVVDSDGLAISLMTSVFKRFGSGISAPGCGFVMQNRGFGFSPPGHINEAAPGKRPFHTVVPAAAIKNGKFFAGFGVVGGAMQPQGQLQLLLRVIGSGQNLEEAMDAPRWRLEGEKTLAIESGTSERVTKVLRDAGYSEPNNGELGGRSDFGGAQWIMRDANGDLVGASDKRKDGGVWGN